MTPGLQRGPPFPEKATKGAVVAIASLEAPAVPMAVGTCEIDVSALGSVQGMKGHAVSTFHWAGDELWSWNPAGKPGSEPPDGLPGWDDKCEDATLAAQAAHVHLQDDQEGGIPLGSDPAERSEAEKAQGVEGEDVPSLRDAVEMVDDKELSQKGKSSTAAPELEYCLYFADFVIVRKATNVKQKLTMLSETRSFSAYATIWITTKIILHSVLIFRCRNQKSCHS